MWKLRLYLLIPTSLTRSYGIRSVLSGGLRTHGPKSRALLIKLMEVRRFGEDEVEAETEDAASRAELDVT